MLKFICEQCGDEYSGSGTCELCHSELVEMNNTTFGEDEEEI